MTTDTTLISADEVKRNAFDTVLHRKTGAHQGGFRAMMGKDKTAHTAAVGEYFQHWDNKPAEVETEETRQARSDDYANLTRQ